MMIQAMPEPHPAPPHEFTKLLLASKQGNTTALQALMPLVEAELRRLAGGYMRNERPGHTLQPTALVNEAWMHMAREAQPDYECRSHFVAIAAQYMRQILIQHARKRNALKRGGGARPVDLEDHTIFARERSADLIAVDDGLKDLAGLDARQAQIIELHFFGGLTYEEIAAHFGIGRSTVIRDLKMAQAWLKEYLSK
jgi:RNA polymerase sigma factor (TIGR02999 family)